MFYDRATIAGPARITRDGYLVADALVGRANNVQNYLASEIGLTDRAPTDVVRIFRPADEVFHRDALASLAHRPVTLDHPSEGVKAENWKSHAVGDVGAEVMRDGDFIRVPLKIMDAAAIESVRTDRREFSLGYKAKVEMTAGVHDGQSYDGRMTDFRYNHLAAVRDARGGTELRIIDERSHSSQEKQVKTITLDGLPVNLGDAAAVEAAIAKLTNAKDVADKALTDATSALDTEKGKVAALEKQLADAKAESDPVALDKRVADRSALIVAAKSLKADLVTDGKTDADIRREVVAAKLGDVSAYSDDGVNGAFAALSASVKDAGKANVVNINPAPAILDNATARDAIRAARYS